MDEKIIREFEKVFEDASPYDLEDAEIDYILFSDQGLRIYFKPGIDENIKAELSEKWINKFYDLVKKYKLSEKEVKQVVASLWKI